MLDIPSVKFVNPGNWYFVYCCKLRFSKCIFSKLRAETEHLAWHSDCLFWAVLIVCSILWNAYEPSIHCFTSLCLFCRGGLTLTSLTDYWYCFGPIKIVTEVCGAVSRYHFHSRLWFGFHLMYLKKLVSNFNTDHRWYKSAC